MHILIAHTYTCLHILAHTHTYKYMCVRVQYLYICIHTLHILEGPDTGYQVVRLILHHPMMMSRWGKKNTTGHIRAVENLPKKWMVSCPTDLDTPKWLMGGVSSNISELSTSPSLVVFFLIVNLFGSCRCNQTCHGNRLQKCWNPRKTFPSQVVGDVSPTIRNTKIPQAKRWLQHIFQAAVKHFTSVPFQVTL
jgi:hypothetical protein